MKKIGIAVLMGMLGALSASATQITLFYTFAQGSPANAVSNIGANGDTSIKFLSTSFVLNCSIDPSGLCGANIVFPGTVLDTAASPVLTLGTDLRYQVLTGSIANGANNQGDLSTTGVYYLVGTPQDTTPGILNFAFPFIDQSGVTCNNDPGCSVFSATGFTTPTPEPGSITLLGSGLVGLAIVARRLRK